MTRTPYLVSKRGLDLALSILALPIVLPLAAIVAVALWVDSPGPILFMQHRTGHHGRRFRMYKFRTMIPNAEELKASLLHLSIVPAPDFKMVDDPRITSVGRLLRRTSLDELPQIINVIKGEMSLVGPRPTSFDADLYDTWHTQRLDIRPGLTGLWQVYGRNQATFDERLRLDIHYIRNVSLLLDLRLLALTIVAIVRRPGV
jgi:lipopolysaccharide/colanic/teichoic acid biosynthesis glycosyltransferase